MNKIVDSVDYNDCSCTVQLKFETNTDLCERD